MTEERITIDIDADGKITAKTAGIYGDLCMDALMEILDADEIPMTIKTTDDYYKKVGISAATKITMGVRK